MNRFIKLKSNEIELTSSILIEQYLLSNGFSWLLECEFDKADITVKDNMLIWNNGILYWAGDWRFGIFKNGEFRSGNWNGGIFLDGKFNGRWNRGIWKNGIFKGKDNSGKLKINDATIR